MSETETKPEPWACGHEMFVTTSRYTRVLKDDGSPLVWMLNLRVTCASCGVHFDAAGVDPNFSHLEPSSRPQSHELEIPLHPAKLNSFPVDDPSWAAGIFAEPAITTTPLDVLERLRNLAIPGTMQSVVSPTIGYAILEITELRRANFLARNEAAGLRACLERAEQELESRDEEFSELTLYGKLQFLASRNDDVRLSAIAAEVAGLQHDNQGLLAANFRLMEENTALKEAARTSPDAT